MAVQPERWDVTPLPVLLDGLTAWMRRKGYASVGDLRGLLAVPADADQAACERAGYVRALRAANNGHGP